MVQIFGKGLEGKDEMRFKDRLEKAISASNQEVIRREITFISEKDLLELAVRISKIRSDYLKESIQFIHNNTPTETEINIIKHKRNNYEEAKRAFDDIKDAIIKGYILLTEK